MLKLFNREKKTTLDDLIDRTISEMEGYGLNDPEYTQKMEQLKQLTELKAKSPKNSFSRDTLLIVGGNLVGILIVVGHERMHVITSKALPMIMRSKFSD